MVSPPGINEWDTSDLPAVRRAYLDSGITFLAITEAASNEIQVLRSWFEPYRNPPEGVTQAKQICFGIRVNTQTYDLFHNAPDGLRGRYWQSAIIGDDATRYFINTLRARLIKAANDKSLGPRSIIEASLDAPSAKVWVREKDNSGNSIISYDMPQLDVPRWKKNENQLGGKGVYWRWTPCLEELEIKGALIDSEDVEHIPEFKRDRANQIHRFGFT